MTRGAHGRHYKVLLYHFSSAEELMREALASARERRLAAADDAAATAGGSLADRVAAVWQALADDTAAPRVLDQATGLALYDAARYAALGSDATEQYLPRVLALVPAQWEPSRRAEVAQLVLAVLRGLLADWVTSGDPHRADAGLRALRRALDAEEAREG